MGDKEEGDVGEASIDHESAAKIRIVHEHTLAAPQLENTN